jgi:hypothetical protein
MGNNVVSLVERLDNLCITRIGQYGRKMGDLNKLERKMKNKCCAQEARARLLKE